MEDVLSRLRSALAGRYTLERELGRGGMATVWLAHDVKHDRLVALKVLRPELAQALGPERFLREIKLTAGLDHPHILALLDSGEAAGFLYYTMPYVEGESLRDRLNREKQLAIDDALAITQEVADALGYAHSRGVIHRDIKPENILLAGGHARVADFGIATALAVAGGERLTETGLAVGTPAYMSPEQGAGSQDLDGRSDIYSLGCVLYELLSGQPPFVAPNPQALLRRHTLDPVPQLRSVRETVSEQLEATVRRALAKVPADRFPTAWLFCDALATPPSATIVASAPFTPTHLEARRGWPRIALLGVAVLVTVAGAVAAARWLRLDSAGPRHPRTTIAVLPFQNLSAEVTLAHFAGGLQEEVMTQLAKVPALRVISRTSVMEYAKGTKPLHQIASELSVGSVIEASVQVDGNRLRVHVQLTDPMTQAHLWAERYDRQLDDAFAVQSDIAQRIVAAVTTGERQALVTGPAPNLEAYTEFVLGQGYLLTRNPGRVEQAIRHFERAIALDSTFARAWGRLAYGYALFLDWDWVLPGAERGEVLRRGLAAARRSLALDSTQSDAWMAQGYLSSFANPTTFAGVRPAFERALELNPRNSEGYHQFGWLLMMMGADVEAIDAFQRALALEPRRPITLGGLGKAYGFLRQHRSQLVWYDSALTMDRGFVGAYYWRADARLWLGDTAGARADLETARLLGSRNADDVLLVVAALGGDTAAGRTAIARAVAGRNWLDAARVALAFGKIDDALDYLERTTMKGLEFWSEALRRPDFDSIRSHPRFQQLVQESNAIPGQPQR